MFHLTKNGPDRAFSYAESCKILAADPSVRIEWSEIERGHWQAVCVCGKEDYHEPAADRVRLDPLDPKTSRHLGQCEFASESDPSILRVLLKATDKSDYWWVQCGACDCGLAGSALRGERQVTTRRSLESPHSGGRPCSSPRLVKGRPWGAETAAEELRRLGYEVSAPTQEPS